MRSHFRFAVAFALTSLVLTSTAVDAQRRDREPRRPSLPATADTNDANAYYQYGLSRLPKYPDQAADAFYWASRLSPAWADPYYARRSALLMSNERQLLGYLLGERRVVRARHIQEIDSLVSEAMLRNPFFYPRFDRMMVDEAIRYVTGGTGHLNRLRTGDHAYDAWMAFAESRFERATELYGEAIRRRPRDYHLRAPRSRAFYLNLQYDSAASELALLLEEMRSRDEQRLVYYYDSKAMLEYSRARALTQLNRYDEAREALGKALEEDLSFFMAHADMAEISLHQGDTTAALSELALAVELRDTDPGMRLRYGLALAAAGRHDEAATQFRAAIEAEPYFALPYFHLAQALEEQGNDTEAQAQYRTFLERAPSVIGEVAVARQRLERYAQGGATAGTSP